MIKLLQLLIFGHAHEWIDIKREAWRDVSFGEPGTISTRILFKCAKCGKEKMTEKQGDWR